MEFAVPCLINSRDFIQIGLSFFKFFRVIEAKYTGQRSSSAISESLSK